jgi:hypothetical protein
VRAHAATAVLSDCLHFCICDLGRALWLEGLQNKKKKKKKGPPPSRQRESHVAACMPAARKEAI